ncbi:MAG: hypothetical protein R3E39_04860 [Anaerolineae bacterium]
MLSVYRIIIDSTILNLALGVIVLGSLYLNARLWLQDYPAQARAKVPPNTPTENRLKLFVMIPMLVLLAGMPLYSNYQLRLANGGELTFLTAFLNTLIITQLFNLFDALVLDLLILTYIKPKFVVIPGMDAAELDILFRDWKMNLRNYLKGIVICTVFSLPIAIISVL